MKQVILGTAGHIDHGKTTLIKALTGIDTDRLKEEKRRGITIELGFAHMELPSGIRVGIVDVPGHEKFVKHMVAGAAGIDIVALIIAADEGVMPQTREHLDICTLLGVKKGFVALTKIDLVDEELLELAKDEIREFLKGSFLEGAPIVPVSAVTGEGIEEFVRTLDGIAQEVKERSTDGLLRIPIDRVFTMKGFGTVITGTLIAGKLRTGEQVEILPSGLRGKVRGIEVHNRKVEEAVAGQRTAVNLLGVEKEEIKRGDVLLRPSSCEPTQMLDVKIHYLPSSPRPLRNGATLRFHIGTSMEMATVILLGRNELAPGEEGYAQLRLSGPVVALPSDRFVLRGSAAIQTLGGGVVLDAHPERHKRFRAEVLQSLGELEMGDPASVLLLHLKRRGAEGALEGALPALTGLAPSVIKETLRGLREKGQVILVDEEKGRWVERGVFEKLGEILREELDRFHQAFPLRAGIPKEELRGKLPPETDQRLFNLLLEELEGEGVIEQEKELVRMASHRVSLGGRERKLAEEVEGIFLEAGLTPPTLKELRERVSKEGLEEVIQFLLDEGKLIKLKEDLLIHAESLEGLKERLVSYLKEKGKISTQELKALIGASRKYVIPIAEYFDRIKLTLRVGDERILRGG